MKLLTLSLVAALGIGSAAEVAARPDTRNLPVESWAPADTADSLWRAGRIAIADEAWRDAAQRFERLVLRYPTSTYAGDALYWQAFALQRIGGSNELRRAARALEEQRDKYPQAATATSGESRALLARVNGRLARGGDPEAAAAIAEIAASAAAIAGEAVAAIAPEVAAELARARPEIEAAVAREMAESRAGNSASSRSAAEQSRDAARMSRDASRVRTGRGDDDDDDDIPPGCEGVVNDERIEALNALMQMNRDQALPVLKRVLDRRDRCSEILRRKAVFIVSQIRSEEAAEILVGVVRNDPDRQTRSEAVYWLSQTNSDRAVEVLEEILLKDAPDEELQKRAVFSLSQTRSPRAATILRDFVRRTDVPVELRGEAIFWLGQANRGENSRFLRDLFPTLDNDELREKVLFSVAQTRNSPENAAWLLEQAKNTRHSPDIRKSALFWASQSGGASVADLAAIYDTGTNDKELREQVIFALSQRRNDTAAVDKLLVIARTEPDRELRRQALFWLGQSRDPRAAAALEEIINKPLR